MKISHLLDSVEYNEMKKQDKNEEMTINLDLDSKKIVHITDSAKKYLSLQKHDEITDIIGRNQHEVDSLLSLLETLKEFSFEAKRELSNKLLHFQL